MFFRDVIDQSFIKQKLIHAVNEGRVAHAQLFLGENGTGGLPLALAYAQYVNCTNRQETDSCGECPSCHKMMTFNHPDLHFSFPFISTKSGGSNTESTEYYKEWKEAITENPYLNYTDWMDAINAENKQGNITTHECRSIIKRLSLKPMYEGFKILILWLPEYLGNSGNILLKSLEEPPENTLFLLVAQNEEMILPTILSRTQMTRIPRLSERDITERLVAKFGLGNEEANRLALLSEGNYNDAMKLMQSTENDYSREFIEWMRMCFASNMPAILKWVDAMAGTGRENQKSFLAYSIGLLRECLLNNKQLPELNRVLESEKDFVSKFSPFVNEGNIYDLIKHFNESHYFIERNAHPKILLFNLSLLIHELLKRENVMA